MVLGLVGETIDVGDEICGARIVDKSKGHHVVYRFELWLRTNDHSTADRCGVGQASFVVYGVHHFRCDDTRGSYDYPAAAIMTFFQRVSSVSWVDTLMHL